jgi:hypothetical protein
VCLPFKFLKSQVSFVGKTKKQLNYKKQLTKEVNFKGILIYSDPILRI